MTAHGDACFKLIILDSKPFTWETMIFEPGRFQFMDKPDQTRHVKPGTKKETLTREERQKQLEFQQKQAQKSADKFKDNIQGKKEVSTRCKEYWIKQGFSEEDAIKEVAKVQANFSLELYPLWKL